MANHNITDATGLILSDPGVAGFAKAVTNTLTFSQLQDDLRGKGLIRSRLFSVESLAPQYAAFWEKSFCN
jgi:hypothetical protein